jgi:hypothetical protein
LTIDDLKDRVIKDGIAYVSAHHTGARQRGGVRGCEACRALHTPRDFERAIKDGHHEEKLLADLHCKGLIDLDIYWERYYLTLQISHCYKVLCVAWNLPPLYASAVRKYADIVGAQDQDA